jgi:hypothetical protein
MDEAKKQKILIGVLVVAVLGAGGIFYMNSGGGSSTNVAAPTGQIERVSRKDGAEPQQEIRKRSAREEQVADEEQVAEAPKKSRSRDEAAAPTKVSRDKGDAKKKDKKNLPAV